MELTRLMEIAGGAMALATAYLTLKGAQRSGRRRDSKDLQLVRLEDPDVGVTPWDLRRKKWLFVVPQVLYTAAVVWWSHDVVTKTFGICVSAIVVLLIALVRDRPPSRVRSTGEFEVEGDVKTIANRALTALKEMRAEIGRVDIDAGTVIARRGLSWRSVGEIITIQVTEVRGGRALIQLESDSVQPSVVFDLGRNKGNVRRLRYLILGT